MEDDILASLLKPEPLKRAEGRALSSGLLNLGLGLLQGSQGQRGRPSTLSVLGQVGPQAVQAYQGSFDKTLRDIMLNQQMKDAQRKRQQETDQQEAIQSYITGLPLDQRARFQAFPTQAAEAMFRERKASPGVVGEYQAALADGLIGPEVTLPQFVAMKKPPAAVATASVVGGSKLTPGQQKVDEKFADDFVSWTSGGGQDMAAQIAQLKPVISALEQGKPITGLQVAIQPDLLLAMTNPAALQSREQVEEVVQRNLRVILGAQFTEKEGERLIARAFNPKLPPQENAKRLRRLFLQMSTAAEQKQAMADYFQESGTLRGFKGKMPSVQDFYNAMEGATPTFSGDSAQSLQDQARRILEQRQGGR